MKVLLISPPSRAFNHYRPPLALMHLAGYLKKQGIATKIIDCIIEDQVRSKSFVKNKDKCLADVQEGTIKQILDTDTDIVCITCYTPELQEVESLALEIKKNRSDIKIIVGGVHPTFYPEHFIYEESNFDFVVIGEGEVTLFELVKAIRSDSHNYASVEGMAYFDKKAKKRVQNKSRVLVENLDGISFPDCEDLDMNFYTTPSPYAIRGVFSKSFYVLSSRGCPSLCTFCVSKKLREFYSGEKFVRLRSPASLFQEINKLRDKYKIDSFYFIDDLFTLKKDNVRQFCRLMIDDKSPLIWGCSSKVNTVDYEMLEIMANAGCVQIDFGVEKGTNEELKQLKKGITVEQIEKTFNNCRKLGIRTFANMLVNTPGEQEDDLRDSLDFIQRLKPNIVSFNVFAPYPGCEIFDSCCENIKREDYPDLMNTVLLLKDKPDKYRFAKHSVDVLDWVIKANKKYNLVLPNLSIYFSWKYIRNILRSRCKIEYLKRFMSLLKEFINQKF
ncbi:MAG: B12-binding domain-containing radical SAM protein [Candidatus Omnitrophica bacterium]|nr:B12-binding domain-containing radical SAM protein [Candidatus Omnitrophota bacterium]MBU1926086.1 B12-binding domain-containing radical SAM protein [Candidatus Omnitrophota bacterium]